MFQGKSELSEVHQSLAPAEKTLANIYSFPAPLLTVQVTLQRYLNSCPDSIGQPIPYLKFILTSKIM